MAVLDTYLLEPDSDEVKLFALAQSYYQLAQSEAWKDVLARLDELVDKAQQEHFSSRATEGLQIVEEKLRWQQRLLVKQALLQMVQSQLDYRAEVIESMKQQGEENGQQPSTVE